MTKKVLITGSAGLIGSEAAKFFCLQGFEVIGVDNNMRQYFFGEEASTDWNRELLEKSFKNYRHYNFDIRDQKAVEHLFRGNRFDLIIHTAAQPSHDWAAKEPLTDFTINATGTLILLEATRQYCPEAVFIFTSTNKVYGDNPNKLPLIELETRYEIDPGHPYRDGIDEKMDLDDAVHSIFGVSKVAADLMVQEYGKYMGLRTGVFRGGCLTGPSHSPTKLHGFLAYLVKCIATGHPYTIYGYKGKQVRDNIHAHDVVTMFYEFYKNPRPGEVYNAGGSRHSHVSMMEAIEKIESYFGRKGKIDYVDKNRVGDHIWYVSDVSKFKKHYPDWHYQYNLDSIIAELCEKGHFAPVSVSSLVLSEYNFKEAADVLFKEEFFVSSHVTEVYGPVQALKRYLLKRFTKLIFIEHPFSYTSLGASTLTFYRGGLVSTEKKVVQLTSDLLAYFRDLLLTLYWFLRKGRRTKVFIGVDNLNALVGVLLKKIGFRFKLIYYSTEYMPMRFANKFLNYLYHFVDRVCLHNADFVWADSPRVVALRQRQGLSEERNILLGSGVDELLLSRKSNGTNRHHLIFVGHLTENKGLDLVVGNLPRVLEKAPAVRLSIFGAGPHQPVLEEMIDRLGLRDKVTISPLTSVDRYYEGLQKAGIGLAFYPEYKYHAFYFSDPVNVREYLACGLPVIVSHVLPIAEEVSKRPLGIAAPYDGDAFVAGVLRLQQDDDFFHECRGNASSFEKLSSWDDIFDNGFTKVFGEELRSLAKAKAALI